MLPRYRILLSKRVAADLDAIFSRISDDSPQNAATMVTRILDAIAGLAMFPHRTVARRQSRKAKNPVRSLPVPPYVVFFRVFDAHQVVRIVQVRHGARRGPRRFD